MVLISRCAVHSASIRKLLLGILSIALCDAERARNFTSTRLNEKYERSQASPRRSVLVALKPPRRPNNRPADIHGRKVDGVRWRARIIPRREIAEKESARSRWTTYTSVYVQCYRNHFGLPLEIDNFDLSAAPTTPLTSRENSAVVASRFARPISSEEA